MAEDGERGGITRGLKQKGKAEVQRRDVEDGYDSMFERETK